MNKNAIENLAEKLNLERYKMFVSLCSADIEKVSEIIKGMESLELCYWSMYYENGVERNFGGDKYEKEINEQISKTCLMIPVLSKNSLASNEVLKELKSYSEMVSMSNNRLQVYPIALDSSITYDSLPDSIKSLRLIEKDTLIRYFTPATSSRIFKELTRKYISALLENINYAHDNMLDSRRFVDLLKYCIGKDCISRSVNDDIKSCDEANPTLLKEAHILTNELNNYDCNTYSCMIISSNLAVKNIAGKIDGVKYYYYCPKDYVRESWEPFKNKIKSFIKKDDKARQEVSNMIRREFCQRNKIIDFFNSFDNVKKKDLFQKYHVVINDGMKELDALLSSDFNAFTILYDDFDEDIYTVPENFKKWLSADYGGDTLESNAKADAYKFIEFMEKFADVLNGIMDVNSVLVNELRRYCKYCVKLRDMERWQLREIKLDSIESKKIVNYALNAKFSDEKIACPFPKIANWMQFKYDDNGEEIEVSDEDVEEAMNNLYCLPITPEMCIEPCYSFVLFINNNSASASWYSTGVNAAMSGSGDTVIVYDAVNDEYKKFAQAFCYLATLDSSILNVLTRSNSVLLTRYTK